MQITYVGLVHDDVQVPVFNDAIIERGETVNVPDVDLALSFLDQPDNWAAADDEGAYFVALKAEGAAQVAAFADELVAWRDAVQAAAEAERVAASEAAFSRVVEAAKAPASDEKPAPKAKPEPKPKS